MAGELDPAVNLLSGGLGILKYWWVVPIVIVLTIAFGVVWWMSKNKKKKQQWTHTLILRSEKTNGELYKEEIFKMRRWHHKLEKTPPLFELERPIAGSKIMVELPEYDGRLSYTIILGLDGRFYLPKKTIITKDKGALEVSVKHAGIDRARQSYGNQFEKMHETPKRLDGITLLKYGIFGIAIVCTMIIVVVALGNWSDRAAANAQIAQAELQSYQTLKEMSETMSAMTNLQLLMMPDIKEMYGNNIQGLIQQRKNELTPNE